MWWDRIYPPTADRFTLCWWCHNYHLMDVNKCHWLLNGLQYLINYLLTLQWTDFRVKLFHLRHEALINLMIQIYWHRHTERLLTWGNHCYWSVNMFTDHLSAVGLFTDQWSGQRSLIFKQLHFLFQWEKLHQLHVVCFYLSFRK